MAARAIERSMWIVAALERAWQAVTKLKQLAQWFALRFPLGSPLMENLKADRVGRSFPY